MHREKDLPELMAEKDSLDPSFVHAMRLLAEEIEKHEDDDGGKKEEEVKKYLDIISNKNIKLCERVLIPVLQYPKFNFVGKLLGPRGNSMKRLQEETGAKMSILGKGSMRDKGKEEELRKSGEAKYGHLSNDLHVLIEVFAPPGEAYTRMSSALDEIKKFLVPDYNDEIRQEQLRELSYLNGSDETGRGRTAPARALRPAFAPASRGRGGIGRGSVASRGALVTQSNPASAAGTRDTPSHRGRGAPAKPGYRPPLLPITHESYEDYSYDDGYDGQYDDESYDAHDDSYSNQSKSSLIFHTWCFCCAAEEDWAACRPNRKAPTARLSRGGFREHPYGRY
uniref:KH domain-containing, RNA-binding, signal transduction-associated protein 2 n=1 Tax=Gadus morhua TaxID=8049 RepID=A0A8C5F4X4_GADMO